MNRKLEKILLVTSSISTIIQFLLKHKSIYMYKWQISSDIAESVFEYLKNNSTKVWVLQGGGLKDDSDRNYVFIIDKKVIIFKDVIMNTHNARWTEPHLYIFRWNRSYLQELIYRINKWHKKLNALQFSAEGIVFFGQFTDNEIDLNLFDKKIMTKVCNKLDNLENKKIGYIFYGPPGNGKSTFIKYLSIKYNLQPLFIDISYSQRFLQAHILKYNSNSLFILEDFFEKINKPTILSNQINEHFKSSMEMYLSFLDGYTMNFNRVCFILTTNVSPDEMDPRLVNRPSRIDSVIEFKNPSKEIREYIFRDFEDKDQIVLDTEGLNLDQCLQRLEMFNEA